MAREVNLERALTVPTIQRFGGLLLSLSIRAWMRTVDYRAYHYDTSVDVTYDNFRGPVIYLLWHEYVLIPFYLRSKTRLGMLASRHRDAEWLSQMATIDGFQVFRGSSGRGGVGALKAIVKQPDFPGFVLTPDGPARAAPRDGCRSDFHGIQDPSPLGPGSGLAFKIHGETRGPGTSLPFRVPVHEREHS